MPTCIEYMSDRLKNHGYIVHHQTAHDLLVAEQSAYTAERQQTWVFHVDAPITPEDIRRCFDFKGHLLFIVDEKLIPDEITDRDSTPMWLRVLHGLYLGRVYVWNGRGVYGIHFNYETGDISESPFIPIEDLRCQETGTWLKGWPGTYNLAFLGDWAWWTDSPPRHQYTYNADGGKQSYSTAGDSGYQSAGYQDYKQQREKAQRTRYDSSGFAYDPNDWPGGKPPAPPKPPPSKTDYLSQFMACGSLDAVKKLYRKLGREFHPDVNKADNATQVMQEINAAYEKAKARL